MRPPRAVFSTYPSHFKTPYLYFVLKLYISRILDSIAREQYIFNTMYRYDVDQLGGGDRQTKGGSGWKSGHHNV